VFLVTLPALIFLSISQATFSSRTALLPVAGFVVNLVCVATAIVTARLRKWPAAITGSVVVGAGIMNMGYMFPFIISTMGSDALAVAVLFDVGNALFSAFLIYPIAEYFGHDKPGFSMSSVRRVVLSPIFAAVAAGLVVNLAGVELASMVAATLDPLGRATVPLMLIAIGMSFGGFTVHVAEAFTGVTIRMLLGGLVGAGLVAILGFEGTTAAVVVVSAAAPVGATTAAIAAVSGLNREVAVNAVSLSALIGLITTSALLYLTGIVFG
jgi:hypothetical protein